MLNKYMHGWFDSRCLVFYPKYLELVKHFLYNKQTFIFVFRNCKKKLCLDKVLTMEHQTKFNCIIDPQDHKTWKSGITTRTEFFSPSKLYWYIFMATANYTIKVIYIIWLNEDKWRKSRQWGINSRK